MGCRPAPGLAIAEGLAHSGNPSVWPSTAWSKGLVFAQGSPDDRPCRQVELTPKGRALITNPGLASTSHDVTCVGVLQRTTTDHCCGCENWANTRIKLATNTIQAWRQTIRIVARPSDRHAWRRRACEVTWASLTRVTAVHRGNENHIFQISTDPSSSSYSADFPSKSKTITRIPSPTSSPNNRCENPILGANNAENVLPCPTRECGSRFRASARSRYTMTP